MEGEKASKLVIFVELWESVKNVAGSLGKRQANGSSLSIEMRQP